MERKSQLFKQNTNFWHYNMNVIRFTLKYTVGFSF